MSSGTRPTRHSFVVRIYQEEYVPGWQGWVQHVGTGESAAVRDMDELIAFFQAHLEQAGKVAAGLK